MPDPHTYAGLLWGEGCKMTTTIALHTCTQTCFTSAAGASLCDLVDEGGARTPWMFTGDQLCLAPLFQMALGMPRCAAVACVYMCADLCAWDTIGFRHVSACFAAGLFLRTLTRFVIRAAKVRSAEESGATPHRDVLSSDVHRLGEREGDKYFNSFSPHYGRCRLFPGKSLSKILKSLKTTHTQKPTLSYSHTHSVTLPSTLICMYYTDTNPLIFKAPSTIIMVPSASKGWSDSPPIGEQKFNHT